MWRYFLCDRKFLLYANSINHNEQIICIYKKFCLTLIKDLYMIRARRKHIINLWLERNVNKYGRRKNKGHDKWSYEES